jgi:glycerol-3-phosphate dehydrogenase (NAD(P)+)
MSVREEFDCLVVGGGTFGTALSGILLDMGKRVRLWVRREDQAREINTEHTNRRYLPDFPLPETLEATTDLAGVVPGTPLVLLAVPSRSFRSVARMVGDHLEGDQIVIHTTKGFEIETFLRMSQILREETCTLKIGAFSGPNLAVEIMKGHPAGATIASQYREVVDTVQDLFRGGRMRVYGSRDVVGTEMAGAFKNIIAVAAGISDGMGFGDNAKALLLTRGLSEMARIGVSVGGDVFTFSGLAGIGDLMATCASPLSRNHQVGSRLARGEPLAGILESMTQVAEGVPTTEAVHRHAVSVGLDLPIVRAVHGILFEKWKVEDALARLMVIPVGDELSALRYR